MPLRSRPDEVTLRYARIWLKIGRYLCYFFYIWELITLKTTFMHPTVQAFEASLKEERSDRHPLFKSGDTISVYVKIKEGTKERIQQFQGTVLQRRHPGTYTETFTVRKLSGGIGVLRVFPFHSPHIEKIELLRRGHVRRARIFYLRGLRGKAARIKEKIRVTHTS